MKVLHRLGALRDRAKRVGEWINLQIYLMLIKLTLDELGEMSLDKTFVLLIKMFRLIQNLVLVQLFDEVSERLPIFLGANINEVVS